MSYGSRRLMPVRTPFSFLTMIHFLARHRQYELGNNSENSWNGAEFSLEFPLYLLAFFNVKKKMGRVGKACGL
jgi:hypothetical protein